MKNLIDIKNFHLGLSICITYICLYFLNCLSPLASAADSGDINALKKFKAEGIPLNQESENGMQPIHYAASNLQLETVAYLLENGVDVNAKTKSGATAIDFVVFAPPFRDDNLIINLVTLLLQKGAKPSSALAMAAFYGRKEVITILLDKGADPNYQNGAGYAALHLLVMSKYANAETAKLLIQRGAKVDIKTKDGKTPLMLYQDSVLIKSSELEKILSGNKL
ncbi:ankyrin repeat domain-containing protein [Leptospira johnsonii]|uniref:Protein kinase n=1 Tax=Leptospira johnsonii TaxID=1917820 RepID=A0A2P2CXK0_9LEPT|nr:ankyrin repeat domain-containing protein [Leptospira johnsonii]GBF37129.1 protein kinase [Leptospira johnsonii]